MFLFLDNKTNIRLVNNISNIGNINVNRPKNDNLLSLLNGDKMKKISTNENNIISEYPNISNIGSNLMSSESLKY